MWKFVPVSCRGSRAPVLLMDIALPSCRWKLALLSCRWKLFACPSCRWKLTPWPITSCRWNLAPSLPVKFWITDSIRGGQFSGPVWIHLGSILEVQHYPNRVPTIGRSKVLTFSIELRSCGIKTSFCRNRGSHHWWEHHLGPSGGPHSGIP